MIDPQDPFALDRLPCEACGYELVGLPAGRACPECGTLPAVERFVCPECGYDLAGLERGEACPECGVATRADETVYWGDISAGAGNFAEGELKAVALVAGLILAGILVSPSVEGEAQLAVWTTVILLVLAVAGVHSSRHKTNLDGLPGEAQLRIAPWGWAARRGVGPAKWRPWHGGLRASVPNDLFAQNELRIDDRSLSMMTLNSLRFRPNGGRATAEHLAARINDLVRQHPAGAPS